MNDFSVTFLMCCYNGGKWLESSISSLKSQTIQGFSVLIVDDGSTDDTRSILQKFASECSYVNLIFKENTGLTDSLNYALPYIQTPWIARIDVDDICHPDRLKVWLEYVALNQDSVLIGSHWNEIDMMGNLMQTRQICEQHQKLVFRLEGVRDFFPHSSAFIRLAALKQVLGYCTNLKRAQDRDLWLRLSQVGKIACIQKPLVSIRRRGDSISHDEGGRRQFVDCRAATVSYFLRKMGQKDPLCSDDPKSFLLWIEQKVVEVNLFEEEKLWGEVVTTFLSQRYKLVGILYLVWGLLCCPLQMWHLFLRKTGMKNEMLDWARQYCRTNMTKL